MSDDAHNTGPKRCPDRDAVDDWTATALGLGIAVSSVVAMLGVGLASAALITLGFSVFIGSISYALGLDGRRRPHGLAPAVLLACGFTVALAGLLAMFWGESVTAEVALFISLAVACFVEGQRPHVRHPEGGRS
jgi:hypothetical protein